MAPCQGTTKTGKACKAKAVSGSHFCSTHQHQSENNTESLLTKSTESTESNESNESNETSESNETMNRTIRKAKRTKNVIESDEEETIDPIEALEDRMTAVASRLEQMLVKKDKTKAKPKGAHMNMTDAGALHSAKFLYYNEHKQDNDIVKLVRDTLIGKNLLVTKTKVVKGVSVEKEMIPWQYIKSVTDERFEKLSNQRQKKYLDDARTKHAAKVAEKLNRIPR